MKCYGCSKESRYTMYLDANNLCSCAMSQHLPYSDFKWLNKKEIDRFDINSNECEFIEENSLNGYIIKVDLEYPDKLHELQNDILSNYSSDIANKYDIKIGVVIKLVPNLGNKSKYVLHYGSIHLYLWLGIYGLYSFSTKF